MFTYTTCFLCCNAKLNINMHCLCLDACSCVDNFIEYVKRLEFQFLNTYQHDVLKNECFVLKTIFHSFTSHLCLFRTRWETIQCVIASTMKDIFFHLIFHSAKFRKFFFVNGFVHFHLRDILIYIRLRKSSESTKLLKTWLIKFCQSKNKFSSHSRKFCHYNFLQYTTS